MKYKQCVLRSGYSQMVVWLDATKAKLNNRVTLKNSEKPYLWWDIISVSKSELNQEDINKNHDPKKLFGSINEER